MNNINYFLSADDISIPYYKFEPNIEIKSAIIVVYEIFGATSHITSFASLLASKGYLVCVPDILKAAHYLLLVVIFRLFVKRYVFREGTPSWQLIVMFFLKK